MFPRRQDRLRSAVTRLSKILSSTLSSESGSKRALLPGLFSSKSNTAAAMMMKPTSKTSRPTFSTTAALFSPSSVTRNLLGLSSRLDRTRTYASSYPFGTNSGSGDAFFEAQASATMASSSASSASKGGGAPNNAPLQASSPSPSSSHHYRHYYQQQQLYHNQQQKQQQRQHGVAASALATTFSEAPPAQTTAAATTSARQQQRAVFATRPRPCSQSPLPPPPQLVVQGTVSRVVFRAADGSYTVFKLKLSPPSTSALLLPPSVAAAVSAAEDTVTVVVSSSSSSGNASNAEGNGTAGDRGKLLLLPASATRVGRPLRVRGRWHLHSKFGGQLAVDSSDPLGIEEIPLSSLASASSASAASSPGKSGKRKSGSARTPSPSSSRGKEVSENDEAEATEAVARLLAGAKLPGVGPAIARRIVDALGGPSKALDALDAGDAAERLARGVRGLSQRGAAAVKQAWDADRSAAVAASFLRQARVPGRLAEDLLRRHGGRVEQALREDAFKAAGGGGSGTIGGDGSSNVSASSFKAIDALAASLGNPATSPTRAEAALLSAARAEAHGFGAGVGGGGHTWIEWKHAARAARRLMAASGDGERAWPAGAEGDALLSEAAAEACRAGRLVIEPAPPPSTSTTPPPTPQRLSGEALTASLASYVLYRCPSTGPNVAAMLSEHFGRALFDVLDGCGRSRGGGGLAERTLTVVRGVGPATARKVVASWVESGARGAVAWTEPKVANATTAATSPPPPPSWPPPDAKVFAPELAEAEAVAARELSRLAGVSTEDDGGPPSSPAPFDVDAWLASSPLAARLSPQQKLAVSAAVGGTCSSSPSVLLLTGGPGTGKTATTAAVVAAWLASSPSGNANGDKRVALAAPTGRAAQRLAEVTGFPASTLHRLLAGGGGGAGGGARTDDDSFRHNALNPLPHDFVLVDECSLLDSKLAAALLSALKKDGGNPAKLVLVGDPDQLPPVGPGAFLEDAVAASFEVSSGGGGETSPARRPPPLIPRVHLSRRFRQSSRSAIVDAALAAHRGEAPLPLRRLEAEDLLGSGGGGRGGSDGSGASFSPTPGGQQSQQRQEKQQELRELPSEALLVVPGTLCGSPSTAFSSASASSSSSGDCDRELEAVLTRLLPSAGFDPVKDVQVLCPVRAGPLGTRRVGALVRELLNPESGSGRSGVVGVGTPFSPPSTPALFRRGDKVMQNANNYDSDVFNGEVGRVESVESVGHSVSAVTVSFDGGRVIRYEGPRDLAQLEPAWATTVHKAQGGESPAVVLVLGSSSDGAISSSMLSRRLLYTALTRASRCVVVVADERVIASAVVEEGQGPDSRKSWSGLGGGKRRTSLVARLEAEARKKGLFEEKGESEDDDEGSSSFPLAAA